MYVPASRPLSQFSSAKRARIDLREGTPCVRECAQYGMRGPPN